MDFGRRALGDRPEWLKDRIASAVADAQDPTFVDVSYVLNGEAVESYAWGPGYGDERLGLEALLTMAEVEIGETEVLDVGAGAGVAVVKANQYGHHAQGLTCFDYRDMPEWFGGREMLQAVTEQLQPEDYIVGDAHHLPEVEGLHAHPMVVMTKLCLLHLKDPLETIRQISDMVPVGGLFAHDEFFLDWQSIAMGMEVATAEVVFDWMRTRFEPAFPHMQTEAQKRHRTNVEAVSSMIWRKASDQGLQPVFYYDNRPSPLRYYLES